MEQHPTPIERGIEKNRAQQRAQLQIRHSHALTSLMDTRQDLRGVHALADFVDDSVRWSA